MDQQQRTAVDAYFDEALVGEDDALAAALSDSVAAGLMAINVSPSQGKLLHILARSIGARRILEVGTLGGYSTLWLARALSPGGSLLTLEIDPVAAETARRNIARAGLGNVVEVRVGPALESLQALPPQDRFDFSFIDANKDQNPDYFAAALAMTRPGGMIVVDNVVRGGRVLEAATPDPYVQGVRRLFDVMAAEPRVVVTAVQTVGSKGWDGFSIALVVA